MLHLYHHSILRIVLLSLLLVVSNYGYGQKNPEVLNISSRAPISNFNPYVDRTLDTAPISSALHDGLFIANKNGQYVQSLVTDWKISDGGKHHHFTIKSDAKWSDGSRLVAEDFARGLRMLLHPNTRDYIQKDWSALTGFDAYRSYPNNTSLLGIRVINDTSFTLTLTQPISIIKFLLSSPRLVPIPPAAEAPAYWNTPSAQVFSGRYKVNQSLNKLPITLERNSHYTGTQEVIYETVNIHRHHNKSDLRQTVKKLREGELDVALELWTNHMLPLEQHQDLLKEERRLNVGYIILNTTRPPFDKIKIRQLFKKTINIVNIKQRVIPNNNKQSEIASYFIPESLGGIHQKPYAQEIVKKSHQALIEELKTLGYSNKNTLKINYLVGPRKHTSMIANYVCSQLIDKEGLIDCNVTRSSSSKEFKQKRKKRDWHFTNAGWAFDYPYAINLLNVFSTGHANNYSGWSNAEYDRKIAEIRSEQDVEDALELSIKAEAFILDQTVILPLNSKRVSRHGLALNMERTLPRLASNIMDIVTIKRKAPHN